MLGLTPVHLNRVLRSLREEGAVTFRDYRATFNYLPSVKQVTEFTPDYLFIEKGPR